MKKDMSGFRDGDVLLTEEGMIFYTFGYVHPKNRVISYLKYLPKKHAHDFSIEFLETEWVMENVRLLRPKALYSPENFQEILRVFSRNFPDYVYKSPYLGKAILTVPLKRIKRVYRPNDALREILSEVNPDSLQKQAVKLVKLLSHSSDVPMKDFGIHGSLALDIHSRFSDIDVSIYGGENFRRVKEKVGELADRRVVQYLFENEADRLRLNKGTFEGKKFVFNAIRKTEESVEKYGHYSYHALKPLFFRAKIIDDKESNFKPAIYKITDYQPQDEASTLSQDKEPVEVVSMIGRYRGVAEKRQVVEVVGTYEKVTNIEEKRFKYRVIVGSASIGREEYLWPVS